MNSKGLFILGVIAVVAVAALVGVVAVANNANAVPAIDFSQIPQSRGESIQHAGQPGNPFADGVFLEEAARFDFGGFQAGHHLQTVFGLGPPPVLEGEGDGGDHSGNGAEDKQ